jgi:hypothetical protein
VIVINRPDAFALIVERGRRRGEVDKFQWFCPKCDNLLHEEEFVVSDYRADPVSQAYKNFFDSEQARTLQSLQQRYAKTIGGQAYASLLVYRGGWHYIARWPPKSLNELPASQRVRGVVDDLCNSVREIASEQNAIGAYEAKQARQDIWIDRECSVEVKPLEFS